MSRMAELDYDIQELFIEGYSATSIAVQLGCPLDQVYATLADFGVSAEDVVEKPQDEYYGA